MPPHDSTLEEIKDRIDIVDLISDYVQLKKAGQNWKGLCPFHAEKTPSFTVSPAKQIFHCFGCGSGGDIFTFLARSENLSFPEVLKILAKRAGVTLKTSPREAAETGEKEPLFNINKDAAWFFEQNLPKHAQAAGYLKGRGISGDIQKRFVLGYAQNSWNSLLNFLGRKGYKPEMVRKAGLATQGPKGIYDVFRNRIMFPIYDLKGDVIAFGGRAIDNSEPKYLNSPETPVFNKRKILYGINHAKDSIKDTGQALLMEGYLDVITAHTFGFTNAVAPLGTACTQEHGKLIKRFAEEAIIVFDSDEAGNKAAKNSAGILLESGLNVKILSIPGKEDPDSFLRKKGKEAFQALLENPLSVIDFFMLQKGDKRIMAREAIEAISKAPDKILQGTYIKMLSEKLNVEERYVREEYQRIKKQQQGHNRSAPSPQPKPKAKPKNELYIIKLLLQRPERAAEVCVTITSEDFKDPVARSIFNRIKEGTTELKQLLSKCDGEERNYLTGLSLNEDLENPEFEDPEKAMNDCIKRMKVNERKMLLQELQGKIKEAEQKKDFALLKQLQIEQQKISRNG
ncbi:MAG: DNA primase [Nitrospiraceae bacterium]|nr:MAG: DNA primase [Nitrospiraceae bacterium]